MWLYWWPHVVFHTVRLFPRYDRRNIPFSTNFCQKDLHSIAVVTTIFAFLSTGFSLCLAVRDPVPRIIRMMFHVFGFAHALLSIATLAVVNDVPLCADTTPELYLFLQITSILGVVLTVITALLAMFWIYDERYPGTVLDLRKQTGFCHDAYTTCPCVWHV
eukprot:gene7177-476_t